MAADQVAKTLCVSFSDVQEAMGRIRQHVHYTPMMQCSHLDSLSGYQLHFKCEMFQKTGAFKVWNLVLVSDFYYRFGFNHFSFWHCMWVDWWGSHACQPLCTY